MLNSRYDGSRNEAACHFQHRWFLANLWTRANKHEEPMSLTALGLDSWAESIDSQCLLYRLPDWRNQELRAEGGARDKMICPVDGMVG